MLSLEIGQFSCQFLLLAHDRPQVPPMARSLTKFDDQLGGKFSCTLSREHDDLFAP
jgi:hypothetical protein